MMRTFSVMRLVAAVFIASGLSMAAGSPSAAQDDEENGGTAAEKVQDLVLDQRERVLDDIASIMAGEEEDAESAEIDADEAAEGEDEGEDGEEEGEDEGEDGEGEDEGVGGEDCELAPSGAVGGEAEGDAVASDEAEEAASADAAEAGEDESGESVGGEVEDAQPAGGESDAAGDQEICTLPSTGTGTGTSGDMHNVLSAFAVLLAVAAAGFGVRQRFI